MPTPRYRIRTIMIVVAICGFMTCAGIEGRKLYRLSRYYRSIALTFAATESAENRNFVLSNREMARLNAEGAAIAAFEGGGQDLSVAEQEVRRIKKKANKFQVDSATLYHDETARSAERAARLRRMYERAARYPWLRVESN